MEKMSVPNVFSQIQEYTKDPIKFLSIQENIYHKLKTVVKDLYDVTQKNEHDDELHKALPELIVDNFDHEQIWQEMELQNECIKSFAVTNLANLLIKEDLHFNLKEEQLNSDTNQDSDSEKEIDENDELRDSEDDIKNKPISQKSSKVKEKSIVDDNFFKLSEMEQFLLTEENKLNKKNEDSNDSIELFDSNDEEEEENPGVFYKDFFLESDKELNSNENHSSNESDNIKVNGKNKVRFTFDQESEESDLSSSEQQTKDSANNNVEPKSSFESRQDRLKEKINKLEKEAMTNINEKPWQLKGEVSGTSRPINSLLEEIVEFDITSRPAPANTVQTTLKLEDIIKQRIKDKSWDDVKKKERPKETPQEYKKKLVLNQEKSKLSLAEIYEKEYLQQKDSLMADPSEEKQEEEPEAHKEIKNDMANLFHKLDTLSQNHFTPKMATPEIKIITNLPTISMEEAIPLATNEATLLAPEEIKPKLKGELMSKNERTKTDKKRERRNKKNRQRAVYEHLDKKAKRDLEKGKHSKSKNESELLNQVSKEKNVTKMNENKKMIKSSTQFFSQLQDEVNSHIKEKKTQKQKKLSDKSASKLKL